MTADELILINSTKVRSNLDLMTLYISHYKAYFGRHPDCAGCTFSNDWLKFVQRVKNGSAPIQKTSSTKNNIIMENIYELRRKEGKIISFQKDGKTHRAYDNKASQKFLADFLTYGSDEEIAGRKKLFKPAPDAPESDAANINADTSEAINPDTNSDDADANTDAENNTDADAADANVDPVKPAPDAPESDAAKAAASSTTKKKAANQRKKGSAKK